MAYFTQLNPADKAKALGTDNADASNGVLFSRDNTQKTALPLVQQFLIIGLGGSGTQTVNRIKGELSRQYTWSNSQVAFLAIDTAGGDLDALTNLEPNEKYLIADAPNIANRHNIVAQRLPFTNEWIHPSFNEKFDGAGAGQNRVVCHAKMFDGVGGNYADGNLIHSIADAQALFTNALPIEVIVILGVSGGTGSGGLINIAHFIREALRSRTDYRLTGYFFMPDVFQQPTYTASKKANGYAALKELDYYYSARQRTETELLKSHQPLPLQVDQHNLLYDTVFLVSGAVAGATQNPYNTAIDAVKESITNLLTEDQTVIAAHTAPGATPMFMMTAFNSNSEAERRNVIANAFVTDGGGLPTGAELPGYFGDDVYNYNAIGVGTASVPTELIKCYAVDQVVQNVLRLSNNQGSMTAVPGAVAVPTWLDGPLSSADGTQKINALLAFNPNAVRGTITHNVSLALSANFSTTRDAALSGAAANNILSNLGIDSIGTRQASFTQAIHNAIDRRYGQFELDLLAFLKEYGPYTFRDLYNGVGSDHPYNGLSMVLSSYQTAVSNMPSDAEAALVTARRELAQPITGLLPVRLSNWVNAFVNNEKAKMTYTIANGIFGVGNYYDTHFLTKVRKLCEECCEFAAVLEGLTNAYGNLAHDFSDWTRYSTWLNNHATGRVFDCIQSPNDYDWAKGQVDGQLATMNYKSIREALADDFMKNRKAWIEFDEANGFVPRKAFDTFIADQVRFTSEITVVSYIQYQVANGANMTTAATNLVNQLILKSSPLFQTNGTVVDMKANCNRYLLVPSGIFSGANGAAVRTAFQSACDKATPQITMQESAGVDNFVLFNQKGGLPIYALSDLDAWEFAYNATSGRLHRNESGVGDFDPAIGLEWKNYPYLSHKRNPRTPDATGAICAEGQFLIREFDPLWEEAVKIGLIQEQQDAAGKYFYEYYNLIHRPAWHLNFDQNTWPKDASGLFVKGMNMFDYFANQNGKTLADITKVIRLEGQGAFSEPNPKQANALDWAKRSLRKSVPMYLEVKKTLAAVKDISKHIDELNAGIIARGLAAKYVACGILAEINPANREWQLLDYPVRGTGNAKAIAKLQPLYFGSDRKNQNRLNNGIVYPVLVSKFQSETENDNSISTFYQPVWDGMLVRSDPNEMQEFKDRLKPFATEAETFLGTYEVTGASIALTRTTLMSKLPGDNYAEIRDCYQELLDLYNMIPGNN